MDEPTSAPDLLQAAAVELRYLAERAEHKDRSVMLDPPAVRHLADLFEQQAAEMRERCAAPLVLECVDGTEVTVIAENGHIGSVRHDWTAAANAAHAILGG